MVQPQFNEEVMESFYNGLVRTIRQIEAAQPESGFSSLFMDMLKRQLELVTMADAVIGEDTGQTLMKIHGDLLRMFTATDLGEVLGGDA